MIMTIDNCLILYERKDDKIFLSKYMEYPVSNIDKFQRYVYDNNSIYIYIVGDLNRHETVFIHILSDLEYNNILRFYSVLETVTKLEELSELQTEVYNITKFKNEEIKEILELPISIFKEKYGNKF